MSLWLIVPLALLLIVIVLILSSFIHFHFRLCRQGKDDRIEFDIRALFGSVKIHYEVPTLVFKNLQEGVKVKLEETGTGPLKEQPDKDGHIDKGTVTRWLDDFKLALRATKGLRKWLKETLSHVRISQLDWSTDFSLGDAAYTAAAAGALWGMKWTAAGWLSGQVRLQRQPRLFVVPVFQDELQFSTVLEGKGKLPLSYALYAGFRLGIRVLKVKGGLRQWIALIRRQRDEAG
ncbi:DUF2953 domain-containing protein [Paenibacillus tengchongensis]|uniref:DUF2953 domain-containing protein n=1 Tax=Paenibacillus tengchongensis TaxID=2608684 RepID=UPI00124C8CF3|nr:DUF2953 domain-containing protein [Paenibacillus tengchongensis]